MRTTGHEWNLTPKQAVELQKELRSQVLEQPLPLDQIHSVGGVDVGFQGEQARAAAVVLTFPGLQVTDQAEALVPLSFPYVPGLLSFREVPAILAALEQLKALPDVLVCDAQGRAHPRRFGLACHLGVLLDHPAVGCAKSILAGRYHSLEQETGSTAELRDGDELLGMAVRTRAGVKPVFVSVGHRVDLTSAVQLVLACSRGYRMPEPTRLADRIASPRGQKKA